jgi:hypothetical protein
MYRYANKKRPPVFRKEGGLPGKNVEVDIPEKYRRQR